MIGDIIIIGLAFLAGYGAGAHGNADAGEAVPTSLDALTERATAAHLAGLPEAEFVDDPVTNPAAEASGPSGALI